MHYLLLIVQTFFSYTSSNLLTKFISWYTNACHEQSSATHSQRLLIVVRLLFKFNSLIRLSLIRTHISVCATKLVSDFDAVVSEITGNYFLNYLCARPHPLKSDIFLHFPRSSLLDRSSRQICQINSLSHDDALSNTSVISVRQMTADKC